jgi:hypothetical protein
VRDLIAALEQIRLRLLRVITALEAGDQDGALVELEEATTEWRSCLEELRA